MLSKALCLVAALALHARCDEIEFDGAEEDGEGLDGDYGDYGGGDEYGGGYGGGGYGDDEYGSGGGDPTPAWETVEDFAGIAAFVDQEDTEPAVVGFFDEERDADAQTVFQEVADGSRYDFRFALVTDAAARTEAKLQKGPAVLVYAPPRFLDKKGAEKKRARYPSAKLDADALKKFITKKSVPLVGQKTWKSGERYDKQGVPVVTLFAAVDLEKNGKGFDYFANRLRKVAVDYAGKLAFNIGDKEDFSYQLEDYDISLPEKKDVGVGAKDGNKYYKMADKFNVDNLRAFAAALVAGELEPKIKEEPDYGDEDYGDEGGGADEGGFEESEVVVLTDDNFAAETDGKDAMLEFYAPWCGHCQALKPTYKELGAAAAGIDDIVVGAMDATANSPPDGYDVSGYPTLIFKKASGATMPYDGDRDVESMISFIKENAESSMKGEL